MSSLIPSFIELNLSCESKREAISILIGRLYEKGKISNKDFFLNDVIERENILSTYCGYGIAIPHAESTFVKEPSFVFGRTTNMIWDEEDEPVKFILLLAIPRVKDGANNSHIELMSEVATLALEEDVRALWESAVSSAEILKTFNQKTE
jgi:mannitol/fructose-specific phosphotransferase system IIA component (Ntr-type)